MKLQLKVSIFALFSAIVSLSSPKQASKMSAFNKYHGLRPSNRAYEHIDNYDNDEVRLG